MAQSSLFEPAQLGQLSLKNRMVMSPMTRCRADKQGVPSELAVDYYQQRSDAGLIITEGTSPSPNGDGYTRVPGIYTPAQIDAWKNIVDAVHESAAKIFLQIMHVGRVAHPFNKPEGAETVAPSAIQVENDKMFTDEAGLQAMAIPRELTIDDINKTIDEYRQAAKNVFAAGFDGIEFHAASGYLPMQFLSSNSNQRTDQYGGSVENRVRFCRETLQAICEVAGSDKVGLRIWPGLTFNDMFDEDPVATHIELLKVADQLGLAYVHSSRSPDPALDVFALVRKYFNGTSILNAGFDFASSEAALAENQGDLIAFGTLYLANPGLAERFQEKEAVFNTPDPDTFYTPGAKGYTDYQ